METNIHIAQEALPIPIGGRDPRDEARNSLLRALKVHPDHALLSRASCIGLLRDFGGDQQPTISVLADCVAHGTAASLFKLSRKKVEVYIIERIADEFCQRTLYDSEICRWAVASWAIGFDIKFPKLGGGSSIPPPKSPSRRKPAPIYEPKPPSDSFPLRPDEQVRQKFIIHWFTIPIGLLVALVGANQWWARFILGIIAWGALFRAVTGILWLCETLVDRFEKMAIKTRMPNHREISNTGVRGKAVKSRRKPINRKPAIKK